MATDKIQTGIRFHEEMLKKIVEGISYYNAVEYFGIEL